MDYINNALSSFGFPAPLTIYRADKDDAAKVVNCLLALLQTRQVRTKWSGYVT